MCSSDLSLSPLIHLVDDDEAVRDALGLLISTVGLRVTPWANPERFLAEFDRARAVLVGGEHGVDQHGESRTFVLRERSCHCEIVRPVALVYDRQRIRMTHKDNANWISELAGRDVAPPKREKLQDLIDSRPFWLSLADLTDLPESGEVHEGLTLWQRGETTLTADVYVPAGPGPFPAVISPTGTPPGATPLPRLPNGPTQGRGVNVLLVVGGGESSASSSTTPGTIASEPTTKAARGGGRGGPVDPERIAATNPALARGYAYVVFNHNDCGEDTTLRNPDGSWAFRKDRKSTRLNSSH